MHAEGPIDPGARCGRVGRVVHDWRISLRARGRSLPTIASYLSVGESFTEYLSANGMPNEAAMVAREHVEQYLADRRDRGLAPATVAKHFAPCSSCSSSSPTTAR